MEITEWKRNRIIAKNGKYYDRYHSNYIIILSLNAKHNQTRPNYTFNFWYTWEACLRTLSPIANLEVSQVPYVKCTEFVFVSNLCTFITYFQSVQGHIEALQ